MGPILEMSPLSPENVRNPDVSFWDKFTSWVFTQGTSTILLIAIAFGVYQKGESIIDRFDSGYERNAVRLMEVAKQRDETMEKLIAQWKDDRRLLVDILRNDQRQIQALEAFDEPTTN